MTSFSCSIVLRSIKDVFMTSFSCSIVLRSMRGGGGGGGGGGGVFKMLYAHL